MRNLSVCMPSRINASLLHGWPSANERPDQGIIPVESTKTKAQPTYLLSIFYSHQRFYTFKSHRDRYRIKLTFHFIFFELGNIISDLHDTVYFAIPDNG